MMSMKDEMLAAVVKLIDDYVDGSSSLTVYGTADEIYSLLRPEGDAHDLRDALDRLGYNKVFQSIADAVTVDYSRNKPAKAISVEKLIYGLTGIDQDNARYLSSVRKELNMSRTTLTDGSPVTPDHREIIQEGPRKGQQKAYVVLSDEERAKGFVRPVRRSYVHEKCGIVTTMGQALAETYARDPSFYTGTFCCGCGAHFPVGEDGEFVWDGTTEKVGS